MAPQHGGAEWGGGVKWLRAGLRDCGAHQDGSEEEGEQLRGRVDLASDNGLGGHVLVGLQPELVPDVPHEELRHGAAGAVDVRVAAGPHEADIEERVACS